MPVAPLLHTRAVQGPLQEGRQDRHLAVPQESNTHRRHLRFSLLQHLLEPSLQHSSIPNHARADTELGTAGTRETQLRLTFPKPTQAPSPQCSSTELCHKFQWMPGASQALSASWDPLSTACAAHTMHRHSPVISWGSQSPLCHRKGGPGSPVPSPTRHPCTASP